ncbi:MAG: DUF86 domain-containing protein [Propionibacteriaceae bacterium]|nr:DUF86 domain-containing protein [Propionibacteriaceae bacterium]
MTPKDFSASVVLERLALMRQLLADLEVLGDVSPQRLAGDRLTRHAVERIVTQLVTLATDINAHTAASLAATPPTDARAALDAMASLGVLEPRLAEALKPSIGLRNVLVHEYVGIDIALVARSTVAARRDHADYVRQVAAWTRLRQ